MRLLAALPIAALICALAAPGARSQVAAPAPQAPAAPSQPAAPSESHSPDWAPLQYVDFWNKGDFDVKGVIHTVFDQFTLISSHGKLQPLYVDNLLKVIKAWHEAIPDLHLEIKDTIIGEGGNKVVMRILMRGTWKKPLFGPLGPGSHQLVADEILIFELKNGKIRQIWEFFDMDRMRGEMGQHWVVNGTDFPGAKPGEVPAIPARPTGNPGGPPSQ
jgi:predicted ester cyclase